MPGRIVLGGTSAARVRRRAGVRSFFVVVVSLLVFLAASEALLRALHLPRPVVSGWRGRGYIPTGQLNELGYRGWPIRYQDDDHVVLLLGDSQVEAYTGTSYDRMPERLLERELDAAGARARVFTVGTHAWGTDQELLGLREYCRRYRVDTVALWFTPRNDVWNNLFPTGVRRAKPTFWIEDGELHGPSELLGEVLARSPSRLVELLVRRFGPTRDERWERRLRPACEPLRGYEGPVVDDVHVLWNTTHRVLAFEDLVHEKSHLSMYLTPPSPRLQQGLELTRRLIEEIRREAHAHGASLFLFTTSIENSLAADEPTVVRWHDRLYRVSRAQFEANERAVMEPFDGHVIEVEDEDWAVSAEDRHLNQVAMEHAMAGLARALVRRGGCGPR